MKVKKITLSLILSALVVGMGLVGDVNAQETAVDDNGAESNNNVNNISSQESDIQQSNTTQINNSVSTASFTGDNSASYNTGGSNTISTGNADSSTTVINSANTSLVSQGCCGSSDTTVGINGNGAGSQNGANISSSSQTTVSINQSTTITNNITQNLVTGDNAANNNNGDVSIRTGNISSNLTIKNGPINIADVTLANGSITDALLKISGNGANSENTIDLTRNDSNTFSITNDVSLLNNVHEFFLTGGNEAKGNIGNVDIATGDIISETKIENGPINVSIAKVTCCEEEEEQKPHKQAAPISQENPSAPAPSPTTVSEGVVAAAAARAEEVLEEVGELLPITGNNWLFFALLGNVMMFLLGAYLRLHSGRSPGLALAFN